MGETKKLTEQVEGDARQLHPKLQSKLPGQGMWPMPERETTLPQLVEIMVKMVDTETPSKHKAATATIHDHFRFLVEFSSTKFGPDALVNELNRQAEIAQDPIAPSYLDMPKNKARRNVTKLLLAVTVLTLSSVILVASVGALVGSFGLASPLVLAGLTIVNSLLTGALSSLELRDLKVNNLNSAYLYKKNTLNALKQELTKENPNAEPLQLPNKKTISRK